jgi:hypothetical protein
MLRKFENAKRGNKKSLMQGQIVWAKQNIDEQTSNGQQNCTRKMQEQPELIKTGSESNGCGRVNSSCSTNGCHCVAKKGLKIPKR